MKRRSRRFVVTPQARADLVAIWEFVANERSPRIADAVLARIYDQCDSLAITPGIGHVREDLLDARFRFWRVYSYLIVYRWEKKPLQVVAVVHGARELRTFLRSRQP